MKKTLKIVLAIVLSLLIVLLIDTIQAKAFNNSPFLKVTENHNGGTLYKIDKGIIVDTYTCTNGDKKTIFKWEKYNCPNNNENENSNGNNQIKEITWEEITEDGVNEELLFNNVDKEVLFKVSTELQTLVDEAEKEERENPEILITKGWARVLEYDRFKEVLDIGTQAMKPLYLIIYKSPNRGEYEYLCAYALYKISGYDFFWATTDEFIEKFNKQILEERELKM